MQSNRSEDAKPREARSHNGIGTMVRDAFSLLRQARFGIIVALIAIPVFFYVDQGVEILRSLGEGNQYDGKLEPDKLWWFAFALVVWALNSWYWARVDLNLRTSRSVPEDRLKQQPCAFLMEHGPRLLGVAPLLIVAGACLLVGKTYSGTTGHTAELRLLAYSAVCLLLAVCLYMFFVLRRKWLERRGVRSVWSHPGEHRSAGFAKLPAGTLTAVGFMVALSGAAFFMFLGSPVTAPKAIGSAAILALGAGFWVCFGSFFVALGNSIHFPVIRGLIALAIISSCFNDNHAIRVLGEQKLTRVAVADAFKKWQIDIAREFPQEQKHPLFIVAAEGGGIRAAYWTATVLGTIQERAVEANTDFGSHVFAISGVSGGSLGAAVFDAEIAESATSRALKTSSQNMLGEDFLSPALAAMLYRDFLQRFIPVKINAWDRGRALEMAWEDGWRQKVDFQTNRFEHSLSDLFTSPQTMVPALLLNGTSVEAGRRLIASNVYVNPNGAAPEFVDATDATACLNFKDMRLSTAAHMSARFTYVSPAGLFPSGEHVVDGGYFENSGEATVWDLLHVIEANSDGRTLPVIIEIGNAPGDIDPKTTTPKAAGEFLSDLMSPLYALLHTRDARGTYSQMLVREPRDHVTTTEVLRFSLQQRSVPLPLGWMLSGGAAREMQDQIDAEGTLNYETVTKIVDRLVHP
jgi:hypothetical protein